MEKNQIVEALNRALDNRVQAGDENRYNDNFQNFVVDKLGLPQNWRVNAADEKKFYAGLPEQMGQLAGTIAKVGPRVVAEGASLVLPALKKISASSIAENMAAKAESTAELYNKARAAAGSKFGTVTVKDFAPSTIGKVLMKDTAPAVESATMRLIDGKPVKMLPKASGSGI